MMDALEVKDLHTTVIWLDANGMLDNLAWPMNNKALTEIDLEIQLTVTASMNLRGQKYRRYNWTRNL